jgi:hypothetical protein
MSRTLALAHGPVRDRTLLESFLDAIGFVGSLVVRPIEKSEPASSVRRAPPDSESFLGLFPT